MFGWSSRNISLKGTTLHAECETIDQQWKSSKIHLNQILGSWNGEFHWSGLDFDKSAEDIWLDGTVLRARLRDVSGTLCDAHIDLNERIKNVNGSLAHEDVWNNVTTWTGKEGEEDPEPERKEDGSYSFVRYTTRLSYNHNETEYCRRRNQTRMNYAKNEEHRYDSEYLLYHRDAFEYSPLPTPTSIRLLKIEPSSNEYDMIRCHLVTVDLADRPVFDALSYTWGQPLATCQCHTDEALYKKHAAAFAEWPYLNINDNFTRSTAICCNGRRMLVKQNLYDALQRIRRPDIVEEFTEPHKMTPLLQAVQERKVDRVCELLSQGADVTACDTSGRTALHRAVEGRQIDVIKALVAAGSDLNAINDHGHRPVDCARHQPPPLPPRILQLLDDPTGQEAAHRRQTTSLRNRVSKSEYFWVDAICINQENDAEKASQVALMGHIYKRAQSVIVWLGREHDEHLDMSTGDLLRRVWLLELATSNGNLGDDIMNVLLNESAGYSSRSMPSSLKAAVADWLSTFEGQMLEGWLKVVPLFKRKWFERAWIIQEVMMGDKITIVCGQFIISWDIFVLMSCAVDTIRKVLRQRTLPWTTESQPSLIIQRGEFLLTRMNQADESPAIILERKRRAYRRDGQLPCLSALSVGRNASATDPRDHVFAVLSFSLPMEHSTQNGKEIVRPNYVKPPKDLYLIVGQCLVEAYGPSILSLVRHDSDSKDNGLPSWAPNFGTSMTFSPIGIHDSATQEQFMDGKNGSRYNAVGDTLRADPIEILPNQALLLKGIKCDVVIETTSPDLDLLGYGGWNLNLWASLLNKLPGTVPGKFDALWRTLINNEAYGSYPAKDLGKEFSGWLRFLSLVELSRFSPKLAEQFLKGFDISSAWKASKRQDGRYGYSFVLRGIAYSLRSLGIPLTEEEEKSFYKLFDDHSDWNSHYSDVLDKAETFGNIMRNKDPSRRLFRTKKNFLGSGPEGVQAGDLVFIIPGASVPYILRSTFPKAARLSFIRNSNSHAFNSYRLIGEAYVHGIMHGEAVKEKEDRLETLTIV